MRFRSNRLLVLLLVGVGLIHDLFAAEFEMKGELGQRFVYNDNIALNPIQKDSVFGFLLTPSIEAVRKSEVYEIAFAGKGDIRRYDDSRWNCTNYSLGISNAYRTRRNIFSLSGAYTTSCSYAQQLVDSGVLIPNNKTEDYQIAGSWTRQWTPRSQFILDGSFSRTKYSNNGSGTSNFLGNDSYTLNLSANHRWNRLLLLDLKQFFSSIQYSGANSSTQNVFGFEVGGHYTIDPYWTFNAKGGPRWVEGAQRNVSGLNATQDSSLNLGYSADVSLNYDSQTDKFLIAYSNSFAPSAIGQTLQTHSFGFSYSHRLTRFVFLDFHSDYSISQSINSSSAAAQTGQFNRDYLTVSAEIGWDFAKNWQLKGSHIFRRQDVQQDTNVANLIAGASASNLVMLFINYKWDGIRGSQ